MVEDSEPVPHGAGYRVRIKRAVSPGDDVRKVGVDVQAGQTLLSAGERIAAAEVGLLATAGKTNVPVYRRPRVAVLSTGDELADPGADLRPGQIRDSNRFMIMEAVRETGATPIDLGMARDDRDELVRRVERGLAEADMLLTSGGVSMGEFDLIKPLLDERGTIHFGRILMKPGKPLTFATIEVEGATQARLWAAWQSRKQSRHLLSVCRPGAAQDGRPA